jgi:hypothetical protein
MSSFESIPKHTSKMESPGGPVGQRLLPVAIDEIARVDPEKVWALLPRSRNIQDGYQNITYSVFANAINRTAWFLQEKFGQPPANTFPTVAFVGLADMRYQVIEMAAAKTGYKVGS